MKLLLIHLSDIHLKASSNVVLQRMGKLFDQVKNSAKTFDITVLVVTGDTAYSGAEQEYVTGAAMINELKDQLAAYSNKPVFTLVIAGNHDCDFTEDSLARRNQILMIQQSGETSVDDSVVTQLSGIQANYFQFESTINNIPGGLIADHRLYKCYRLDMDGRSILFHLYNTAYISEIHEQPGKLLFPINLVAPHVITAPSDLSISLFHHPFNWLNPSNRREFVDLIHRTSDFFLTGHEHEFSLSKNDDLKGDFVYHIEGSVLQDSNAPMVSEMGLIGFDLDSRQFKAKKIKWEETKYAGSTTYDWTSWQRGKEKWKNKYIVDDGFQKFLDDIGGKFTHPAKIDIKLSDLYVYPKLKCFNPAEEKADTIITMYEDAAKVIDINKQGNKILLFGEETIGKSSFLKIAFRDLLMKGCIPVYIHGTSIRTSRLEDFQDLVKEAFGRQYSEGLIEDFSAEDLSKVYILIDDIHKTPIKNHKAKHKLLKSLTEYYNHLIIVGNELFIIEDLLKEDASKNSVYSLFVHFELLELNKAKRSELIQKWYSLGQTEFDSDDEFWKKCDNAARAVEIANGQRVVPNYPFFLLILLQTLESANPHDLKISSYGNYYQLLILKIFSEKIKDQADIGMYQNYASELAYEFFTKNIGHLNEIDFYKFHTELTSFTRLDMPLLSAEKVLKTLQDVNVIISINGTLQFKYRYTYYYFVAQYFARGIRKPEISPIIEQICRNLHKSENASIVLFLIQFSSEEYIIKELLHAAKAVFSENDACKLENDIDKIHDLLTEIPKLYLKSKSVEEMRKEEAEKADELEELRREDHEKATEETDSEIDLVSKLNLCFKLIEILGQTIKNTHGTITGQLKFDLLKETYLLALRTLNAFFKVFNEHTNFFVQLVKSNVKETEGEISDEKLEKKAKAIVFSICSQFSLIFIKKLSDSLGSAKLADKYPKIQLELDYCSVKLANFLIKLDHESGFPDKELSVIKKDTEKHTLTYYVLKRMVINHLHRNTLDFKAKQQICSFLNISVENQLAIQAKQNMEGKS